MRTQLKLTITRSLEDCDKRYFDEVASSVEFSADMSDADVHAWFGIFQRALQCQGFCERVIANGACKLAFNAQRDPQLMKDVYQEFELDEFHPEPAINSSLPE